jgi:hypothetical protein
VAIGSAFALIANNGNNYSMAKLLLLSTLIAMIGIPISCATARSPRRGLQRAVLLFFAYNLFYLFAVRWIYPHLL